MTTNSVSFTSSTTWTAPALLLPPATPFVTVTCIGAAGYRPGSGGGYGGLAAGLVPVSGGTVVTFDIGTEGAVGSAGVLGTGGAGGAGGAGGTGYSSGGAGGPGGSGYNGGAGGAGGGGSTAASIGGSAYIVGGGGGGGGGGLYRSGGSGGDARPANYPLTGTGGGGHGGVGGVGGDGGSGGNGAAGSNAPTGTGGVGGTGFAGGPGAGGSGGAGGGGGWSGGGGGAQGFDGGGGGESIVIYPAAYGSFTPGYNALGNGSASVTYTVADPPLAPTLNLPTPGQHVDLQHGTPTFEFTYNPGTDSGALKTWSMHRKVGAGSYNYWTCTGTGSGDWTSTTRVENAAYYLNVVSGTPGAGSVVYSYTFPTATWTDGTTYLWSVATVESYFPATNIGPFASDITVIAVVAPIVAVTGPTSVTTAPFNITWADTFVGGVTQGTYRVLIYSAAQRATSGFTPGVTAAQFDSGTVTSTATTLSIGLTDPSPRLLSSATYYPYVMITDSGGAPSSWASSSFSVLYSGPVTPTLTVQVSSDPVSGQPIVNLYAVIASGGISATTFNFQYSDDFGGMWYTVRNGGAVDATSLSGTAQDRESAPSAAYGRVYRVQCVGYNSSVMEYLGGPWSVAGVAFIETEGRVFISDPLTPGSAVGGVLSGNPSLNIHEVFTRYYPIGRGYGIKSTEGTKGFVGSMDFVTLTTTDRLTLANLLAQPITFLVQFPREAYYFTTDGDVSTVITWETMAEATDGYSLAVTKIPIAQAARP